MQYSIEKFKLEDWEEIEPREEVIPDLLAAKEETIFKEVYLNGMPFFTYRQDGKIIMIYGMLYEGCGTYVPSIIISKYINKYMKTAIKLLYEYYATYVGKNVRRLEAYCDIMDVKAIRLAQHFGFQIIGIRHHATAEGHDQAILERLTTCDPRKVSK